MRLALYLLGVAWLFPAALFLGWAVREVARDLREQRAESAEMREHQRRQDALRRAHLDGRL